MSAVGGHSKKHAKLISALKQQKTHGTHFSSQTLTITNVHWMPSALIRNMLNRENNIGHWCSIQM